MKERGTYFVPTIATVEDLIEPGGDYDNALLAIRGRAMLPRLRETAEKAWKLGIKLVAGTDTGYAGGHSELAGCLAGGEQRQGRGKSVGMVVIHVARQSGRILEVSDSSPPVARRAKD
jgi:hypothetical protein